MKANEYRVRFVPLGGVTDVTKNMYLYEAYRGDELLDILIVDCGIGFPKEKDLGVDLVIPDISYLLDKKDKIRAVLLTHGHEDHISALKFHYKDLGSPKVYGSRLTAALVESQFQEKNIALKVTQIRYNYTYVFGLFSIEYIHTTHSIPDTTNILIKTPVGTFYHGSDFKLDLTPPYGNPPDFYAISKAGKDGVLCLLSDCLGVEREGYTLSESVVGASIDEVVRNTKGLFIMTTFSSNISRMRQCIDVAIRYNRKICFLGRSMQRTTDLAKEIGYLPAAMSKFQIQERDIAKTHPSKLCIIATGSQGQFGSAMSRISEAQHRYVRIQKGDKVLFSSDPIPGNEEEVGEMIEKLYQQGADVIYSDIQENLHASGHASREEIKLLMRFTKPKFLCPIGGTPKHQRRYRELAESMGWQGSDVFTLKNGQSLWFDGLKAFLGPQIPVRSIYIDAYGVDGVGNMVLRDRKSLSQEGIIFVILPIADDMKTLKDPEIRTRGFMQETEEKDILKEAKNIIKKEFKPLEKSATDTVVSVNVKREVVRTLEKYFLKKTGRRPLIVVEVVSV